VLKNGAVLHVDSVDAYGSMDEFKKTVIACELHYGTADTPWASFKSPSGDKIEASFGSRPLVNQKMLDYDLWPLFESKFASVPEDRVIDLKAGNAVHRLDFR
jgi:hypothetical protein